MKNLYPDREYTNVYFKSHKYSLSNTYKLQDYPLTNDESRYVLGTTLKNANSLIAGRMNRVNPLHLSEARDDLHDHREARV